jgi:ECF transporter S component (folate family)
MFGPIVGGAAGLSADLISYLLSRQVYPINPLVTLGAMAIGLISGLVSHYLIKRPGKLHIVLSCALAHLVGSMIIKPLGLYQFYGVAVLWRIPLYLAIAPVEIAILCLLYRNRMIRTFIDDHTTGGNA